MAVRVFTLLVSVTAFQQTELFRQEITLPDPFAVVPLDKQYVPIQRNNVTVAFKTAYFGEINVGVPAQRFSVVFDTGSAHVILPSTACNGQSCLRHRRYDLTESLSARPISEDPTVADHVSISFGTGEVMGNVVQELVCLNPQEATWDELDEIRNSGEVSPELETSSRPDCTLLRVILAKTMTDEPFDAFAFDGILGLGLESLALHPEFSFFGRMAAGQAEPRRLFGLYLSQDDTVTSEIAFGGVDGRHMASALQWTGVAKPELGYWQIPIHGVRVGEQRLDVCNGAASECSAIVDTGTSLFGVPASSFRDLHLLLVREVPEDMEDSEPDCRTVPGPDLVFELGDFELTLTARDYSRESVMRFTKPSDNSTQAVCRAALLKIGETPPLSAKTFIFGEPLLRRYYTAYDWEKQRIGFATASQPIGSDENRSHQVIGGGKAKAVVF